MHPLLFLLAEGPAPQPGAPLWSAIIPFVGIMLLYFLIMRPRRPDNERQALLAGLKKNDKILTTAGIYGTIVAVAEKEDEVTVRVDDNVRLKMVKASIARNLTNEEALKAAQKKGATPAAPAPAESTAITTTPKT